MIQVFLNPVGFN